MSPRKKWTLLTVAPNSLTASLIKGKLESANIPVILRGEAAGRVYGLTAGPLAETQIFVPAPYHRLALNILNQLEKD